MGDDESLDSFELGKTELGAHNDGVAAPTRRTRQLHPGNTLGRYVLEDELGEGGMATVFLAEDTKLRRKVAVKVLFAHLARRRDVVLRFHRESRAAAALDHRNILRVFDVGGGDGTEVDENGLVDPPYIVLELVRGASLRDLIEENDGPMLAEIVACLGIVLCRALSVAHKNGIIHRDVKPANVMVADGGRVVLADFGVAQVAESDTLVTRTGALLGTPAFMSPEQATGAAIDARSDLYSLGATLYCLATGVPPFSGNTAKVVSDIVGGRWVAPSRHAPTIGPQLSRIIARLMSLAPDDRFDDAEAVEEALLALVQPLELEPEQLLREFLDDPATTVRELRRAVTDHTFVLARSAADSGDQLSAMALADRCLALDPEHEQALALVEGLGRRRWRGVVAVGAIAAVALVVLGTYRWWQAGPAESVAVSDDAGSAVVAEVEVAVDASRLALAAASNAPADAAPAPVRDAAPLVRQTTPSVTSTRRAIPAQPPSPVEKPKEPEVSADAAVERSPVGWLLVRTDAWCELSIDGRGIGRPTAKPVPLSPGRHLVRCSQGKGMPTFDKSIEIVGGETTRLTVKLLDPVPVSVALAKGHRVEIAGTSLVSGRTVSLPPDRYRIRLIGRDGAAMATTWVTIVNNRPCEIREEPRLGCYGRKPGP